MAVKLHRCLVMFVKMAGHPCWEESKELVARIKDGPLTAEPASPR